MTAKPDACKEMVFSGGPNVLRAAIEKIAETSMIELMSFFLEKANSGNKR